MPVYSRYYDTYLETLPRADILRMQQGLLLQLLPYAYERSAATRKLWQRAGVTPGDICSIEDFCAKVPFLDKDFIRNYRDEYSDPFGGLRCVDPPHLRGVGFTSGTTGDPTPLPYSHVASITQAKRDFWNMGVRPGDYIVCNLFTFREGHGADRYIDCDFRPITFQHSPRELPRLLKASAKYRPTALMNISTPIILAIDELTRTQNIDVHEALSSYKAVVFGGEVPGPRVQSIVAGWGLELFQQTSLGDIIGAIECTAHDGFHAWEDMAFVECLDPEGSNTAVSEGEVGELVVTSLKDDVAPLIRYRTDDLVRLNRAPCICGRTHLRFEVLGRKGDQLIVQGQSILPKDITPLIENIPATAAALFQIIRRNRRMDRLELRVGFDPRLLASDLPTLSAHICSTVGAVLNVTVAIELVPNADLLKLGPPHKIPRVTKS